MEATEATRSQAAEFVDFFAAGWAIGATNPERFFAHFGSRMTEDTRMIQPLSPVFRGSRGLRELFAPLFEVITDLRGEVLRWGETDDGVLVELRLAGTLGGRPIAWVTVDRITVRDGVMLEREAHFDPLPLVGRMLRAPRASMKLIPLMLRRKESR